MKKLLLTLALLFAPSLAWGQCNGVFSAGDVCGSVLGGIPGPVNLSQGINPVIYGADPTGVNDSSPAVQTACNTGPYIIFPPGNFKMLSKVTCNTLSLFGGNAPAMVLQGSGADNTRLSFSNSTDGIEIDYSNINAHAEVRDLSITTNQAVGGIALTFKANFLQSNAAVVRPTNIYNVVFRGSANPIGTGGWSTNLNLQNVSNVVANNVFISCRQATTQAGTAIEFIGNVGLSSSAVSLMVVNSFILNCDIGIQYDALAQGLFVLNTNLTAVNKGIFVPSGLAQLTELSVNNCQFNPTNNTGSVGVDLESGVSAVSIANSLFINGTSATSAAIIFNSGAAFGVISNNSFAATSAGVSNGVVLTADATNTATITQGNVFSNFATAVTLGSSTDFQVVSGNGFTGNTTAVTNSSSGTHNRIEGNTGYNPVGIVAPANVCASPCTITAGPSPETHYVKQSANFNAAITKGGNAVCTTPSAAVPCVIDLWPNEAMVVTWTTTTPTDTKDVH